MSFKHIRDLVASLPEIGDWPELATVFDRAGAAPRPDWELPMLACQAAGGARADALPVAAAIACLQLSIIIVDDILDEDPRGAHVKYKVGPASNMALAYEALALRLIDASPLHPDQKLAIMATLSRVGLQTAIGQHMDVQNLGGQSSYWKVVTAKSTPFYGGALKAGAVAGGASSTLVSQMYDLGLLFGEIVQIEDDLSDALETPANADWKQGRNNLLILYAQTADHSQRSHFAKLLSRVDDPEVLAEAQQILLSSGAVAYSAYLLVIRYQAAHRTLAAMDLADRPTMTDLLNSYAGSLLRLLNLAGVELSRENLLEPLPNNHRINPA
ncbi:MAG: polyprenyl synthetase family protein [Chloroflexota bacterium]|nr:MAG: polyprenyl synthetase family protein [Chloroflexota bacterium]